MNNTPALSNLILEKHIDITRIVQQVGDNTRVVATSFQEEDAQRIIDCVNALDGIENLADWRKQKETFQTDILMENSDLKAALEFALPLLESCAARHTNGERIYEQALEALNKAKQ